MIILVVEDDVNLGKGICFALKREGYEMELADSIGNATKIMNAKAVDLMILDLNLPDGDGLDFCMKIREKSTMPILMLTARDMETDEVAGLECGADDYITKPFSLAVLKVRVGNLAKRKTEKFADEMNYQEFSLNKSKMKIRQNGQALDLTVTEYKLLKYFLENSEQVLTKEQILEAIWDIDGDFVDHNTLAVNIRRLRKKIAGDWIKTVFGVGYCFGGGHE